MKQILKIVLILSLFFSATVSVAQSWTWKKGTSAINWYGVYGTQTVPALGNYPGARAWPTSCIDAAGSLWLYGGSGYGASSSGVLADLWKYNPSTNEWTWFKGSNQFCHPPFYGVKGVPSPNNHPGSIYGATMWADNSGNLWLFGGYGMFSNAAQTSYLNTMWRYTISTNEWTWVSGDTTFLQPAVFGTQLVPSVSNKPAGRSFSVGWKDQSGNFWVFGGNYNGGNELWKYNPSTNEWTWMKGSQTNLYGTYGTFNVSNATNNPGRRSGATAHIDSLGDLWLYGGKGISTSTSSTGYLNDVWKFDIGTNNWIWKGGDSSINVPGFYGIKGISTPNNKPQPRMQASGWSDGSYFWIHGGNIGFDDPVNDLWRYNTLTNRWTWIKGDSVINQFGIYGTIGVAATNNKTGTRIGSASWMDSQKNLWLFGGHGCGATSCAEVSDLWKFNNCIYNATSLAGLKICSGTTTATLNVHVINGTVTWFSSPTSTTPIGSGNAFITTTLSTGTYTYYAESSSCASIESRAAIVITVQPSPIITVNSGSICSGNSFTIIPTGATSYTFSSGNPVVSPTTTTSYSVIGTNSLGCVSVGPTISNVTVSPFPLPTITINSGSICSGNSFTMNPNGATTYTFSNGNPIVSPPSTTSYTVIGINSFGCSSSTISTVTVSNLPLPTITVNSGTICSGSTYTMNPVGASTYTISGGNTIVSPPTSTSYVIAGTNSLGCISSSTLNITVYPLPFLLVNSGSVCAGNSFTINPTGANSYTYLNGGPVVSPIANSSYSIAGSSSFGCLATNTAVSNVVVLSNPTLMITSTRSLMCFGENVEISASGANTYSWSNGNVNATQTVSPNSNTTYTVIGFSANGCTTAAVFTQLVSNCTELFEGISENDLVSVYPNPNTGVFQIVISKNSDLTLINSLGEVVLQTETAKGTQTINMCSMASGIYFLKLTNESTEQTIKVIKQE